MISRALRYNFSLTKTIPSAKTYIENFASLQKTLTEQTKKLHQLQNLDQLATQAQLYTITDTVKEQLAKLSGRSFESKAMKRQREELITYRRYLENLILESDQKWAKPREEIRKLRKEIADQFLSNFVRVEESLLKNCSVETSPQLAEGLTLIHRLLLTTIQKHGVTFFEPQIGEKYSPELHDTVDKDQNGHVIKAVVSRGWKIDEKVVKKPIVRLK